MSGEQNCAFKKEGIWHHTPNRWGTIKQF